MCAPSPPPAPDLISAAKQQGAENIEAARVQNTLNNPNVVSPYGTQTFTHGSGFNQAGYDTAQSDYDAQLKKYLTAGGDAQQQTLSGGGGPGNYNTGVENQRGGGGDWRSGGGITRPNPNYIAKPAQPNRKDYLLGNQDQATLTQAFSPEQQALYNQSTATQQQLGRVAGQGATALEGVVGTPVDFSGAPQTGNYETTRKTVIDAMMGRANEDYTKRIDNDRSNLVAAGIPMGSKAYADNQQMIERSRNDAYQQAEIAGGNAASQAYGMDEARRRQAITEMLAQRQTPLNEISALLSGSQVSNPFSMPGYAANTHVQPTPLYGAAQATGQYGTDVYNSQAAQAGNTQSGLVGLGGTALMAGAML